MSFRAEKPNFLEFWVKMPKMTLKVKVNDIHFQYQLRISQDACLVQIWWFQLKSVMSYHADKVQFKDRRTDRRTDAGNDNTPSAWKVKGSKTIWHVNIIWYRMMWRDVTWPHITWNNITWYNMHFATPPVRQRPLNSSFLQIKTCSLYQLYCGLTKSSSQLYGFCVILCHVYIKSLPFYVIYIYFLNVLCDWHKNVNHYLFAIHISWLTSK